MTFMITALVTTLVVYLLGYIISFLWLFLYFDKHNMKYLKADLVFSLCSWVMVFIVIVCYGINCVEEAEDRENENQV